MEDRLDGCSGDVSIPDGHHVRCVHVSGEL